MTIPNDVRSAEDLDDVLATIGTLGIDASPSYLPRS
jgi:hypothetical protein